MKEFQRKENGIIDFVNSLITINVDKTTTIDEGKVEDVTSQLISPSLMTAMSPTKLQLERNYVCTDTARNKFHRLIESSSWQKDDKAVFLKAIIRALGAHADTYMDEIIFKANKSPEQMDKDLWSIIYENVKPFFYGLIAEDYRSHKSIFNTVRNGIGAFASI